MNFKTKDRYGIQDLLRIMEILRAPGGCPWDRRQTHESIRKNMIEETYEVVEAIDKQDPELLKEELGDVLLQVVFHSRMEQEAGRFDFDDVCDGICKKLIVRHPHIFGDVVADTSAQVLKNWDEIKKKTKGQKTNSEVLESVPRVLPALMRSTKVQQKAARASFDWPDVSGALEKLVEEIAELREAVASGGTDACQEELGDVLFSVVNVSRFLHCDAEEALTKACDKFVRRFEGVEHKALAQGKDMRELSLDQLDALWDEVKREEP